MKKTIVLIIAICMFLCFAGCANTGTTAPVESATDISATDVSFTDVLDTDADIEPEPDYHGLSDDPMDFELYVDGTVFTFPCEYVSFTDAGWNIIPELENGTIEPGKVINVTLSNERGYLFDIMVKNYTEKTVKYSDAAIIGYSFNKFGAGLLGTGGIDIHVAGGIHVGDVGIGSTNEEVDAVFGIPDMNDDNGKSRCTYYFGNEEQTKYIQLISNKNALTTVTAYIDKYYIDEQ